MQTHRLRYFFLIIAVVLSWVSGTAVAWIRRFRPWGDSHSRKSEFFKAICNSGAWTGASSNEWGGRKPRTGEADAIIQWWGRCGSFAAASVCRASIAGCWCLDDAATAAGVFLKLYRWSSPSSGSAISHSSMAKPHFHECYWSPGIWWLLWIGSFCCQFQWFLLAAAASKGRLLIIFRLLDRRISKRCWVELLRRESDHTQNWKLSRKQQLSGPQQLWGNPAGASAYNTHLLSSEPKRKKSGHDSSRFRSSAAAAGWHCWLPNAVLLFLPFSADENTVPFPFSNWLTVSSPNLFSISFFYKPWMPITISSSSSTGSSLRRSFHPPSQHTQFLIFFWLFQWWRTWWWWCLKICNPCWSVCKQHH